MDSLVEVYGASWCPATNRTLSYLDLLGIDHEYVDAETDLMAQARVAAWNGGRPRYPTLQLPNGQKLMCPTEVELDYALRNIGHGAAVA